MFNENMEKIIIKICLYSGFGAYAMYAGWQMGNLIKRFIG